jgi:hypothetical protein
MVVARTRRTVKMIIITRRLACRNPGRQPISPSREPLKMITEAVATNDRSRLQRLSATSVTRFGEAQPAGVET